MKWIALFLAVTLFVFGRGMAQTNSVPGSTSKTETIYIPTGKPPPATTENYAQPFFASTAGYEVNEEVEELKSRVEKLEEILASQAAIKVQPGGNLLIESKGDIEISTPGVVKFNAKSVEIPKQ